MELIELKKALKKMLDYRYDEDKYVGDGYTKVTPNKAGRLSEWLDNDALDEAEVLMDVENWMEANEPYLTHIELSLKSEVNRHICILLTKEEL